MIGLKVTADNLVYDRVKGNMIGLKTAPDNLVYDRVKDNT